MPNNSSERGFAAILVGLFIIYSVGLVGVTYYFTRNQTAKNTKQVLAAFNDPENVLYLNISGQVKGKIIEIKDAKAYIETEKGGKLILSLPENLVINQFESGKLRLIGKTAGDIKFNQLASLQLKGYGSGFAVTAITYGSPELKISIMDSSQSAKTK